MARVKNFWDLKNITSYSSHTVDQFDDNTPGTGGGNFKWVATNNAAITDIAGIRIKPTGTTDGYWLRHYEGAIKVEWFGTNYSTTLMSALGVSQATANTRYGAGLVTVATDTYDTAAIKFAMKLMETQGYQAVEFAPNRYRISSSINLPVVVTGATVSLFSIKGNGAIIQSTTGMTGDLFRRIPTNQSEALNTYNRAKFEIDGFQFIGDNAALQCALRPGPSYESLISNIEFANVARGIHLEFALGARVVSCKGLANEYGFMANYGVAWGGSNADSQSNHTVFHSCRIYNNVGATASFYVHSASGCSLTDCIVEGNAPLYGVYFNFGGSTVVKDFTVTNTHVEVACTNAAFYLRCSNGSYHINKVFNQYGQTLIEADVPTGYPQLNVSNISFTHASTKFANANGGAVWKFIECELGEPPWGSSPSTIHPYHNSAWVTGGAYFKPTSKYNSSHVEQPNYRCYVIDPVLRQDTND